MEKQSVSRDHIKHALERQFQSDIEKVESEKMRSLMLRLMEPRDLSAEEVTDLVAAIGAQIERANLMMGSHPDFKLLSKLLRARAAHTEAGIELPDEKLDLLAEGQFEHSAMAIRRVATFTADRVRRALAMDEKNLTIEDWDISAESPEEAVEIYEEILASFSTEQVEALGQDLHLNIIWFESAIENARRIGTYRSFSPELIRLLKEKTKLISRSDNCDISALRGLNSVPFERLQALTDEEWESLQAPFYDMEDFENPNQAAIDRKVAAFITKL